MQPTQRLRRGLGVALALAALAVSSGCSSGFDSPVLQDYNPAVGVNVREGDVWAMNLLVVLPESGQGTLVGSLLNQTRTADRMVAASVRSEPNEEPIRSSMLVPGVPLAPDRLVSLNETPTVAIEGNVAHGRFVNVTLVFQRAERIDVKVPVVAPVGPYAEVPLPSPPSPTPTATTPTPSPTATPTAQETPASTASPTG